MNTPQFPHLRLSALLIAVSAATLAANAQDVTVTLLDEAFADGQRTVENLPTTAAWYGSGSTTLDQPAAGSLVLRHTATNAHLLFHFAPAGSPYALAVGETLNVSLNFNLTKALNATTAVRLGVLNSQNTRVSADGAGVSNTLFNDDRGYGLFFNPIGTANNLNLRARNASNGSLFTSATPWASLVNGPGTLSVADDQTYALVFKVKRTDVGADIFAEISGGNLAAPINVAHSVTSGAFTTFDMFGIALLATATSGTTADPGLLTVSNVKVTATSPAPPPPPPPPSENNLFLNETFPDGQRTTENLPTTAAWYGSNSTLGQVAPGSIRSTLTSTANQHVFTHFRPLNSPYPLTVGEKITVSFNMNLTKALTANAAVRIGLLNSNGTRVTNDTTGVSSGTFSDDRGYGIYLNPRNDTGLGGISLLGRTTANTNLLTAVAAWTSLADGDSTLMMSDSQTYSVSLSVRRTATGTLVKARLSGGDLAAPIELSTNHDAVDAFTSFDKFGVAVLSTGNSGTPEDPAYLTLSNVHIAATTLPDALSSTELFNLWKASDTVTFADDANADGVADGMAWLLGAASPSSNSTALLPVITSNGSELTMVFSQLAPAGRAAARLQLQHSADLVTWTTVTLPTSNGSAGGIAFSFTPNGSTETVQAVIPVSVIGTGNRSFVRLVGELAPAP